MGKVILVGAGPGDPDLITVRGRRWLERADVIVADRLVSSQLLDRLPAEKLVDVGKGPTAGGKAQAQINRLLIELAGRHETVVRLKGGDPLIFGRGGEELEALVEAGIAFEIVPGITAAQAVCYAGIPLTHRDLTSTVALATGRESPDKEVSRLDHAAMAKMGTLAFYMSVGTLAGQLRQLVEGGLFAETPAAVVENASTGLQRTIIATVARLAEEAERHRIQPPALVVIGEVTELRTRFEWFEHKPLAGQVVALTQPAERIERTERLITDLGGYAVSIPSIRTEPVTDTKALDEALGRIGEYDWLVITSQVGARVFFERFLPIQRDIRKLADVKIAVIGSATAEEFRRWGIEPDAMPGQFTSDRLAETLIGRGMAGRRILMIRSEIAPDDLEKRLQEAGANVHNIVGYRTVTPEWIEPSALARIERLERFDWVLFSSASTVDGFFKLIQQHGLDGKLTSARYACIGPVTAERLRQSGREPSVVSTEHTLEGLVEAVRQQHRPRADKTGGS